MNNQHQNRSLSYDVVTATHNILKLIDDKVVNSPSFLKDHVIKSTSAPTIQFTADISQAHKWCMALLKRKPFLLHDDGFFSYEESLPLSNNLLDLFHFMLGVVVKEVAERSHKVDITLLNFAMRDYGIGYSIRYKQFHSLDNELLQQYVTLSGNNDRSITHTPILEYPVETWRQILLDEVIESIDFNHRSATVRIRASWAGKRSLHLCMRSLVEAYATVGRDNPRRASIPTVHHVEEDISYTSLVLVTEFYQLYQKAIFSHCLKYGANYGAALSIGKNHKFTAKLIGWREDRLGFLSDYTTYSSIVHRGMRL